MLLVALNFMKILSEEIGIFDHKPFFLLDL